MPKPAAGARAAPTSSTGGDEDLMLRGMFPAAPSKDVGTIVSLARELGTHVSASFAGVVDAATAAAGAGGGGAQSGRREATDKSRTYLALPDTVTVQVREQPRGLRSLSVA